MYPCPSVAYCIEASLEFRSPLRCLFGLSPILIQGSQPFRRPLHCAVAERNGRLSLLHTGVSFEQQPFRLLVLAPSGQARSEHCLAGVS